MRYELRLDIVAFVVIVGCWAVATGSHEPGVKAGASTIEGPLLWGISGKRQFGVAVCLVWIVSTFAHCGQG